VVIQITLGLGLELGGGQDIPRVTVTFAGLWFTQQWLWLSTDDWIKGDCWAFAEVCTLL